MDILTQGLLGASLAQSGAKQNEIRIATWVGFASGLLADADVFIQSSVDPLLTIEYHRHFTPSLFFVPFGALIAALLLWPFVRKRLKFSRLFVFSLLGYSLSGVLDTCTSYGTHLFWPLMDTRTAWHIIAIIDPVFTLVLLLGVVYSIRKHSARFAKIALVFAAMYMAIGWMQLQRAEAVTEDLVAERGHRAERLLVKPTVGNLLLWRSVYQYNDHYYVDAVRLGIISSSRIYPGGSIHVLNPANDLVNNDFVKIKPNSVLQNDIQRFTDFSDGWVTIHPERTDILMDVRYSVLTDSLLPLWGIEMDMDHQEQHAKYSFYRDMSKQNRHKFLGMLLGRDVEQSN